MDKKRDAQIRAAYALELGLPMTASWEKIQEKNYAVRGGEMGLPKPESTPGKNAKKLEL